MISTADIGTDLARRIVRDNARNGCVYAKIVLAWLENRGLRLSADQVALIAPSHDFISMALYDPRGIAEASNP